MPDTILEGDHPRIISGKFGWDWLGSFRGEDFFLIASPFFLFFKLGGHLGWKSGSQDTILEGGHPRTSPPKFGCNWPSGFWGEDFYVNFP
jgi:hypothetical protein